jgi:hypothetical protein
MPHSKRFPDIDVFCLPDIVQRQNGVAILDTHPFHNPLIAGTDIQIFQKFIGDNIFGMKMCNGMKI